MQQLTRDNAADLSLWSTLDDLPNKHPNFNRGQIEWLYRKRYTNGFSKAFRKIGNRRYVHLGFFADCLLEGAGNG